MHITNIRREQDACRRFVVDSNILEIGTEIIVRPFGFVAKGDKDPNISGRTIHDLSCPKAYSVNDATETDDKPALTCQPCTSVVRQVLSIAEESNPLQLTTLMDGDVAEAARKVGIHAGSVCRIPEAKALVLDLFALFGWTLSPAEYDF